MGAAGIHERYAHPGALADALERGTEPPAAVVWAAPEPDAPDAARAARAVVDETLALLKGWLAAWNADERLAVRFAGGGEAEHGGKA